MTISSLSYLGSTLLAARHSDVEMADNSVILIRDDDSHLIGLRWPYALNDQGMYNPAKYRQGRWTGKYWSFPTPELAEAMLGILRKKFPDLAVIEAAPKPGVVNTEAKTAYCVMAVADDLQLCLLSQKLSPFTPIPGLLHAARIFETMPSLNQLGLERLAVNVYWVSGPALPSGLVAILATPDVIAQLVLGISAAGATERLTLAKPFQTATKVKVRTSGWAVSVRIDLSNPRHWALCRARMSAGDGWADVSTTRKKWSGWLNEISAAGLDWEGDDPAADLSPHSAFDASTMAGWSSPAPNGHLMHAYQKEGAEFCARRGMRALIGDEMGIGKTVQAIAAAEATGARRVIVICPANARYVWDREIRGWGGRGQIQHITNQLDTLDAAARWHIITYDLVTVRTETWRLNDERELAAFSVVCPDLVKQIKVGKRGQFPRTIALSEVVPVVPAFADPKRVEAWEKVMRRLHGELLEQILAAGPVLAILDEAHRVKNKEAKRTRAIQRIAEGKNQVLLLTGTPLRNNEHEAAVLLSLLDTEAAITLSRTHGYTIRDVKDYLNYFMIRRTKAKVLPELPPKTRQRIELSDLDPASLAAYRDALQYALECYDQAIADGRSMADAKQRMQGGIERARVALGVAKVLGGEVADLVLDVVENKGCCVVFCAHHEASDSLKDQLVEIGLRVAVVDGRTPQKERAAVEAAFQGGRLDVFIGGINAAGESITLTRADTVIFVELDWVPGVMLQAENRIHRIGQKCNCQVIQLIARLENEDNLDGMMVDIIGSKIARIGLVLDEGTDNIIADRIQNQIRDQLLEKAHAALLDVAPVIVSVSASERRVSGEASGKVEQRKRGRPKVYIDHSPPSSTERSKQSIKALSASGGKRVMLRLTPDAYAALRAIMAATGIQQETAAINQAIVDRMNELLRATA